DNSPHPSNLPLLRIQPKRLSTQRSRLSANKTFNSSRSQSKGLSLDTSGYGLGDMITCESPTEATSPAF
ncbi:11930_t:CDS:1, partial [Acaulospora colombiana]